MTTKTNQIAETCRAAHEWTPDLADPEHLADRLEAIARDQYAALVFNVARTGTVLPHVGTHVADLIDLENAARVLAHRRRDAARHTAR